jgi:hypothetical protein
VEGGVLFGFTNSGNATFLFQRHTRSNALRDAQITPQPAFSGKKKFSRKNVRGIEAKGLGFSGSNPTNRAAIGNGAYEGT